MVRFILRSHHKEGLSEGVPCSRECILPKNSFKIQNITQLYFPLPHLISLVSPVLENYILRSNGIHKILQKYKHKKCIKQERHRYMWFTQFGLCPRSNNQSFFYYIIQQNEEIQPTIDLL